MQLGRQTAIGRWQIVINVIQSEKLPQKREAVFLLGIMALLPDDEWRQLQAGGAELFNDQATGDAAARDEVLPLELLQ